MVHIYMRFPGFRSKAVTLSYDDAVVYDERLISIMKKNGIKGTFNLNSGLFSTDGKRRLTKQQALELYSDPDIEVALHGAKHLPLDEVNPAVALNDIISDRIALEEMFETFITGLAYSYGAYSDNVVEMLKLCGVEYARTVMSTGNFDIPDDWLRLKPTCHHNDPKLMELARIFIEGDGYKGYYSRKPWLFYLWGHSFEFNDDNNWEVIEKFAEYIGGREDVWYATNIEICQYVKAYDSLVFTVNEKLVKNPTCIDVYMNYNNNEYIIPAGKTIAL